MSSSSKYLSQFETLCQQCGNEWVWLCCNKTIHTSEWVCHITGSYPGYGLTRSNHAQKVLDCEHRINVSPRERSTQGNNHQKSNQERSHQLGNFAFLALGCFSPRQMQKYKGADEGPRTAEEEDPCFKNTRNYFLKKWWLKDKVESLAHLWTYWPNKNFEQRHIKELSLEKPTINSFKQLVVLACVLMGCKPRIWEIQAGKPGVQDEPMSREI